ncbi:hypothetical protein Tco_0152168 [Tanacetum coccineum]
MSSSWLVLGRSLALPAVGSEPTELPDRNAIIKDSPVGKIGLYTRLVEFANFHVPLSKFLLCILKYYQINLAQLSVIGAVRNLDSLENWNNHFFWIDAFVCPFSIPWFNGTSVVNDPLLVDDAVDLPCMKLLNENRTLIRKYPEIFLCVVGLSRSYTETDVRLTFLYNDDEGSNHFIEKPGICIIGVTCLMCVCFLSLSKRCELLVLLVKSTNPFKVKVSERTLADDEVPLLEETEDMVISPSARPSALTEGVKISEHVPTIDGKILAALRRLELQSGPKGAKSPGDKIPISTSFRLRTRREPERDNRQNLLTTLSDRVDTARHPMMNSMSPNKFDSPSLSSRCLRSNDIDQHMHCYYYFSLTTALRNHTDARFLDCFNVNSAQYICMVSELRLRYEHEIMSRERFQKKFTESCTVIQQRDAKIAALKAKLEMLGSHKWTRTKKLRSLEDTRQKSSSLVG